METKYKNKLMNGKWQKKRLFIMQRDNFKCRLCGSEDNLNVHHLFYIKGKSPWEHPDNYLITFCEQCHKEEHDYDKEIIAMELLERISLLTNCSLWHIKNLFIFSDMLAENEKLTKHESFKIHLIDMIKKS